MFVGQIVASGKGRSELRGTRCRNKTRLRRRCVRCKYRFTNPRIEVVYAGGIDRGRFFDPVNRKWLLDVRKRQSAGSLDQSNQSVVDSDVVLISCCIPPHEPGHGLEVSL